MKNQSQPGAGHLPRTVEIELFGLHYMVDAYGADPTSLADISGLESFLIDLAASLGMHPIADPKVLEVGPKNRKDPGGISGFLLIAESHISFHTFPKRRFLTLDLYTCQSEMNIEQVRDTVQSFFGAKEIEEHLVRRGTRYPSSDLAEV